MNAIDEISRRYHETRRAVAAHESLRHKYRRIDLTLTAITLLLALAALAVAHAHGTLVDSRLQPPGLRQLDPERAPGVGLSLAALPISPKLGGKAETTDRCEMCYFDFNPISQ